MLACACAVFVAACSGGGGSSSGGNAGDGAGTVPAAPASTTIAPPAPDLRVVAVNQLHGLFCPEDTDACDAPARLELLWRHVEAARCPDVVGLAEIGPRQQELVPARLEELCDGAYTLLWDPAAQGEPFDQEMILTTVQVLDDAYVELSNLPWSGHWVQLDTEIGVVDLVMTHQASSSNNPPCTPEICSPACRPEEETGTCHSRELVRFLDEHGARAGIQIVAGDLNRPATDPRIGVYRDAGFEDSTIAAGAGECDPATGRGCTCCIGSDAEPWDGGGLTDASLRRDERIDFVLVRDRAGCAVGYDPPDDADGDGLGTGPFAAEIADPPVRGVLWPSDHAGVAADLSCR